MRICALLLIAGFVTSALAEDQSGRPSVSPDGSRIAFLSTRGGTTDLFVISPDGGNEKRLTATAELEGLPSWSRKGTEIRYSVFADGVSRIYSILPDGGTPTLLGTVPGRSATISPDGRRVLYSTGTWTAVTLFTSLIDGSNFRRLSDGTSVIWNAQWSPNGKWIGYTGRDSGGALHVYLMRDDGAVRRQLTHIAEGNAQCPAWSADGRRIAVQVNESSPKRSHIWIIDLTSGKAQKLAPHDLPYLDELPSWFPDGKRVAFQSDRSGRMEVWVMNIDGSGAVQVTKSQRP